MQAWWNAESIGEYWTLWNMPVHQWMIKHIYIPTKAKWHKKWLGLLVCFGVSAVFHEILIAVPLHSIKGYAFWGMIGQVHHLHPLPQLPKSPFNAPHLYCSFVMT